MTNKALIRSIAEFGGVPVESAQGRAARIRAMQLGYDYYAPTREEQLAAIGGNFLPDKPIEKKQYPRYALSSAPNAKFAGYIGGGVRTSIKTLRTEEVEVIQSRYGINPPRDLSWRIA